jgi:hypothetical protein
MPRNTRAEFLVSAGNLSAAYLANAAELPGLDGVHRELSTVITELTELGIQQEAQTAAVQQTTKDIKERLLRGKLLATRLRSGVKSHYGTRTEKVIAFGIRPFRKPTRPPKVIFRTEPAAPAAIKQAVESPIPPAD